MSNIIGSTFKLSGASVEDAVKCALCTAQQWCEQNPGEPLSYKVDVADEILTVEVRRGFTLSELEALAKAA